MASCRDADLDGLRRDTASATVHMHAENVYESWERRMNANITTRSLVKTRWAVRGVFTLGIAASVAANILHAEPSGISRAISAWPPVALLLTIELVSRIPSSSRLLSAARVVATTVIAGIAAWVSYWHMVAVATHYGEEGASAYLLPVSVDGLVVVASVCLVELGRAIASRSTIIDTVAPEPAESVESVESPVDVVAEAERIIQTAVPARSATPRPRVSATVSTGTPRGSVSARAAELVANHPDVPLSQLAAEHGINVRALQRARSAARAE